MARSGHLSSHSLQQVHCSGLDAIAFSSLSSSNTLSGQKWMQIPHPLHHCLLMFNSFSVGLGIEPFLIMEIQHGLSFHPNQ
jgi:hypothetical protein